jgi:hypothetical protein
MTTGTLLAFIVTGIIVLVAIVGGIWLETRLPGPHDQRRSPPGLLGQPRPQAMFAGGHRADVAEAPWDGLRTRGVTAGKVQLQAARGNVGGPG